MDKNLIILIIVLVVFSIIHRYNRISDEINKYDLPKIIWTHWDNIESAPLIIKNIFELRKNVLKDWTVHVLSDSNIDKYINKNVYPKNYNSLIPSQKSDWIRLYLLKHYGGLWLDAGIVINDVSELDKLYNSSILNKSEFSGFYLKDLTINNDPTTFIESWFLMAPKNSRIINAWFNEFEYAINIGFINYKNKIIKKGVNVNKIFIFGPEDVYLTIHATLQKILQLKEISNPVMILNNAEDTMFKLHVDCKWKDDCIYNKISTESLKHLPYIKLRGSDRRDGNFILIN